MWSETADRYPQLPLVREREAEGEHSVSRTQSTSEEIVQRGQALYEEKIRPKVEAGHRGEYLILNVDTGDYVMDPDDLTASKRARVMFPNAPLYTVRVGYPTAYRLGGRFTFSQS
jgi:hypothetical protein